MKCDSNITFYNNHSLDLANKYDSIDFEDVHKDWIEFIPETGLALDIGAGSGRDARYLTERGLEVFAVEPAQGLLSLAMKNSVQYSISWSQDSLPELSSIKSLNIGFDLILVSAVWMHLPKEIREKSMTTLARMLTVEGVLVITLRHGQFEDERVSYEVSTSEIFHLAKKVGLRQKFKSPLVGDNLGRVNVGWEAVVIGK